MRTEIGCVALLLGVMGCLTSAAASENAAGAAEKRGLSPIILDGKCATCAMPIPVRTACRRACS